MAYIYNNIVKTIDAPVGEVYEKFCQLETWPGWFSYIIRSGFKEGHTWKAGDKFFFVVKLPVLPPLNLKLTLISVKENEEIIWGSESVMGFQKHEFHFKKIDDNKCELTNKEWSGGLMTVINYIPGFFITHVNKRWANDIAGAFK